MIEADRGTVALEGIVSSEREKERMVNAVEKTVGVERVDDRIQVISARDQVEIGREAMADPAEVDRNIAALVRSALSGDPSLPMRDDSVHVKVDNGHVILHGWVNSDQEKEMISTRVRAIEGVQALDNRLEIVSGAASYGSSR